MVAGKVTEVGDHWVTIIPDDKKIEKMLIPTLHVISVEYKKVCLTDNALKIPWCDICHRTRVESLEGETCPDHPEQILTKPPWKED